MAEGGLEAKVEEFDGMINLITATITSAISGYVTIAILLAYLKKNSTKIFVYWRIIVGILIFTLIGTNLITP